MKVGTKRGILIGIIIITIIVLIAITILMFYCVKFMFNTMSKISYVIDSIISFSLTEPEEPKVKYGEFPFELVYEIDGETITVNDVYVCEYDGISADTGRGKYRKWKGYIMGTGRESILIKDVDDKYIYCSVGAEDIYMGDCEPYYEGGEIPVNEPVIYSKEHDENGGTTSHIFNETDMEKYGIIIISYNFTPPITNSFGWKGHIKDMGRNRKDRGRLAWEYTIYGKNVLQNLYIDSHIVVCDDKSCGVLCVDEIVFI